MKIFIIAVLVLFFLSPVTLFAKDVSTQDKDQEVSQAEKDIYAVPPILDPEYRHRKRHQFEFSPYGGSYLGTTLGQTWNAGARAFFHLNNTIALGGNFGYSRLLTNRDSTFGRVMTNNNMYLGVAECMMTNDAALRVGDKLIEMDFYLMLGAGTMWINGDWEPMGEIGGGVKVYTGLPWLAFRIDVTNYAHYTNWPGGNQFDFDVLFLGGVSFLFPTNPSPYEKK